MLKAEFCSRSTFFWEFIFQSAGSQLESATPEINDPSESGRKAQSWFFRAMIFLKDGQTFSNLLDARKQQLETTLASASVISWAFEDTTLLESQDSKCVVLEGFVHASTKIRLGSLKRVFPEKQETYAGEIVEEAFQEVKSGPGKVYMCHPMIKTFLEKNLAWSACFGQKKAGRWSRIEREQFWTCHRKNDGRETMIGRGTMICQDPSQVEAIFRSENVAQHQAATLRWPSHAQAHGRLSQQLPVLCKWRSSCIPKKRFDVSRWRRGWTPPKTPKLRNLSGRRFKPGKAIRTRAIPPSCSFWRGTHGTRRVQIRRVSKNSKSFKKEFEEFQKSVPCPDCSLSWVARCLPGQSLSSRRGSRRRAH